MLSVIIPTEGVETVCRRPPSPPWCRERRPAVIKEVLSGWNRARYRGDRAGSPTVAGLCRFLPCQGTRRAAALAAGARPGPGPRPWLMFPAMPARCWTSSWIRGGPRNSSSGVLGQRTPRGPASSANGPPLGPYDDPGPAATVSNFIRPHDHRAVGGPGAFDRTPTITSGSAAMRRTPAVPRARLLRQLGPAPHGRCLRSRIIMVA